MHNKVYKISYICILILFLWSYYNKLRPKRVILPCCLSDIFQENSPALSLINLWDVNLNISETIQVKQMKKSGRSGCSLRL